MEVNMEYNENLRNNLIRLRKERNITQEVLAEALGISVQAISKWETGVSLPDIMQLPRIAQFYGVTIDYLFYIKEYAEPVTYDLPDDDKLRIVQFRGNRMLKSDLWEKDKKITLQIPEAVYASSDLKFNVEVWGSAEIHGDIKGYAECGGSVSCGAIGEYVECGGSVSCGAVGEYVECGGSVSCGSVGEYVECGGGVSCGDISQYVECGGNVSCGDIRGNVECQSLNCENIEGDVECGGDIRCKSIKGNVECKGNIIYKNS